VKHHPAPHHFALTGIDVAVAALIVALIALVAVVMAWRALRAMRAELIVTREQMKASVRVPSLHVSGVVTISAGPLEQTFDVTLSVANSGERASSSYLVEFLVPTHVLGHAVPASDPDYRKVGDLEYRATALHGQTGLFPNNVPVLHAVQVVTPLRATSFTALCRVYDEYGKYPADRYDAFQLMTNRHIYELSPEPGPPD
jgi:hypothetical protein